MERSSSGSGWRGHEGNVIGVCGCECACVLSWESQSTSYEPCTLLYLPQNTRVNMTRFSKQFTWIWVLWIHALKSQPVFWEGQLCWWKRCACGFRLGGGGLGFRLFACTLVCMCSHIHLCEHERTSLHACTCNDQPTRLSIRRDSFTSWSQIWISSDEILFPLDWSPSPLIPAQELHD